MFDRYTEHARRVIFFARYEASTFGSGSIETEHLLLGLLREDQVLSGRLPIGAAEEIRKQIEHRLPHRTPPIPASVDLPLSDDSQRALSYSSEESDALRHKVIDCGHLVLGLLRVENCTAAALLRQNGIDYTSYRGVVSRFPLPRHPRGEREPIRWVERPTEPAAPSLGAAVTTLETLVDRAAGHLDAYTDADGEQRLKRNSWSRKEALGHLIDWATTHHQWFARALTEPKLVASGYPQEEWVSAQQYRNFSWQDLVDLWVSVNRHLVHVLAHIREDKLETPCRIGVDGPIPLSKLIARYVERCEDILGQNLVQG